MKEEAKGRARHAQPCNIQLVIELHEQGAHMYVGAVRCLVVMSDVDVGTVGTKTGLVGRSKLVGTKVAVGIVLDFVGDA